MTLVPQRIQADSCIDDEWTREETDYLFALAREYDLRFLAMANRYYFEGGPTRQIEVFGVICSCYAFIFIVVAL